MMFDTLWLVVTVSSIQLFSVIVHQELRKEVEQSALDDKLKRIEH